MMPGLYAALAAQALAETEARLQAEEAARQHAAQSALADYLRRRHEARDSDVIDVQAREVPDVQALPAPTNAPPIRDQVGTTERDTNE